MYPVFVQRWVAGRLTKENEEAWYREKQAEMKALGFDLPDLDWLVGEEAEGEEAEEDTDDSA